MPRGEHSFLHTDDGDECALDEERITITRRQFNVLCDLAARGLKRDNEGGCSSSSDGDLGWDALKNVIVGFGDIERAEYGYADRAESDAELQLVLEMSKLEADEQAAQARAAQDQENAPASAPRAGADAPARVARSETESLYDH